MKKNFAILTLIAAIAFAFTMPKEMLKVDTDASYITWKGYKVTGQHHGKVKLKGGNLEYDNGKLIGGNFEIDMTTITNEDLQGGSADKLIGHLKSEDFFGVEKHPTAKFVITKIAEAKLGEYRVKGDLTIKSTTKPVSFNALISEKEEIGRASCRERV